MGGHALRTAGLLAAAAAASLLFAGSASAQTMSCTSTAFSDDFNRADGTDLGAAWTETGTDLAIASQTLTNPTPSSGMAQAVGASGSAVCMDVSGAPAGQVSYAAAVLGIVDATDNVFIKFQNNDGDSNGLFDSVFFYRGNNNVGTPWAAAASFPPFSAARVRVAVLGSEAQIDIDTDDDGTANTSFGVTGAPLTGGTGVGVGVFNGANVDNFRTTAAPDADTDGRLDALDNCPVNANAGQADTDADSIGDACDPTPNGDTDGDGVDELADNCPTTANPGQTNTDGDAQGDACDADDDGDGVADSSDSCPLANPAGPDNDSDGCTDAATAPPNPSSGAPAPAAFRCFGVEATITGTPGRDVLTGTEAPDVIVGLGGNDTIRGLTAEDTICGNAGNDKLFGGPGNDVIRGGRGKDKVVGGPGRDTLNPGRGGKGPKDVVAP